MEKEEIVSTFIEKGLMIDSESLEYFYKNPEQIDIFLEKIGKTSKPEIVTIDFLKSLFGKKEIKIEELKKKILEKRVFTPDDIARILLDRYEKIRSFLSYRMDIVNLVSINKVSEKTRKFSLIAMVREIDRKSKTVLVEDLTGEISLFFPNDLLNSIVQDEVLGLVCEKTNERIDVLNVLWPDIPLKRRAASLDEDICCVFLSEKILEENEEKLLEKISEIKCEGLLIFLFSEFIDKNRIEEFGRKLPMNSKVLIINKKLEGNSFSTPVFFVIEEKIKLLFSDGKRLSPYQGVLGEKAEEVMLNLLKKRHLDPVFDIEKAMIEDCLVIDPVPDIFLSFNFGLSGSINYKGTTIISCGTSEQIFWIVNLKSRESLKINLT